VLALDGFFFLSEQQISEIDARAERGAHLMGHVSRVHRGQAIFGLSLAKLLLGCDVLKENQDACFTIEIDILHFDVVGRILVHPQHSNTTFVLSTFFDHAGKVYDLGDIFIYILLATFSFIESHGILLVVTDLVLGYNLEFDLILDVYSGLSYPIFIRPNLIVLEQNRVISLV